MHQNIRFNFLFNLEDDGKIILIIQRQNALNHKIGGSLTLSEL